MAKSSGPVAARGARRRAREFALQGLYQWQLAGTAPAIIAAQLAEAQGFGKIDLDLFTRLLHGVIGEGAGLEAMLVPHLDRPLKELSPVERAVLLIATYELARNPEVPYRVVINEAVELAKIYGGTDGHKYVNAVLDKLSAALSRREAAGPAA